ncbi:MAG: DUF2791 family P-loop domain-containing protein [Chloroflexi bacterium]|nr:DUF2791 family P-loop domain-containing protein [Chloroflexota bacterium]
MATSEQLQHRRAIEALRAGVPSRAAVIALGSAQPKIEERFRAQLEQVRQPGGSEAQPGLLIAGDFGSGKSHLLEYLQHVALDERFVCSKVVISKETPLHDPGKLFQAAIRTALVPERKGSALTEIAAALRFDSPAYAELLEWLNSPGPDLDARFAATLFLYERVKDLEIRDRLVSFWAGDPINQSNLRAWLRAHGQASTYKLDRVSAKELPYHRFRFVSRLIAAAGYSGWVLLIDEVELIGRYSFKQRAKSYAELARWAGALEGDIYPRLVTVFAITVDYAASVLQDRNDEEAIPGKLRATGLDSSRLLASQAERGMRLISRGAMRLDRPTASAIEEARDLVREIHASAYRWEPPPLATHERLGTTSMRQYVRRWINEWDLKRLNPEAPVEMVVTDLTMDYSENPALEAPSEDE